MPIAFMKQLLFALTVLCFAGNLSAQDSTSLSHRMTQQPGAGYTHIPHTRISLALPAGYQLTTQRIGVVKGTDANTGISVMDLPGNNFFIGDKDFNRQTFESKGGKIKKLVKTSWGKWKVDYLEVTSQIYGIFLNIGDSSFTVTLIGTAPAGDDAAQKEIRDMMLSMAYQPTLKPDPLEDADFTLNLTAAGLEFDGYSNSTYTMLGGDSAVVDSLRPLIIITQLPPSNNTMDEWKYFARSLKSKTELHLSSVKATVTIVSEKEYTWPDARKAYAGVLEIAAPGKATAHVQLYILGNARHTFLLHFAPGLGLEHVPDEVVQKVIKQFHPK